MDTSLQLNQFHLLTLKSVQDGLILLETNTQIHTPSEKPTCKSARVSSNCKQLTLVLIQDTVFLRAMSYILEIEILKYANSPCHTMPGLSLDVLWPGRIKCVALIQK